MVRDVSASMAERKGYQKPIVVRVKLVAEEAVLTFCKTATGGVMGMMNIAPCITGPFGCTGAGS